MKIQFSVPALAILSILSLNLQVSTAFAQGSLTPPASAFNGSVPQPTMLTLTQVQPRTPVDPVHTGSGGGSEYLILQPGSYYLTSNVLAVAGVHGINISASDVTLDLRGFSVIGSSSGLDGIYIHAGYTNITVRNGNIDGWSNTSTYGNGVESYADNVTLEHLNVSANHGYGITLNGSSVVRACSAEGNGNNGINATNNCIIVGSTANRNSIFTVTQSGGITVLNNCMVINCIADNNFTNGIYAANNCTIKDCSTSSNLTGIQVVTNCTVEGCTANANHTFGIIAFGNCQINRDNANGNGQYGIYLYGAQNRVDSNNAGENGNYGIGDNVINNDNAITRNFAPGNGFGGYYNYNGGANTDYGPLASNPSTATSPWSNFQ